LYPPFNVVVYKGPPADRKNIERKYFTKNSNETKGLDVGNSMLRGKVLRFERWTKHCKLELPYKDGVGHGIGTAYKVLKLERKIPLGSTMRL
jgi:hypothetical protein